MKWLVGLFFVALVGIYVISIHSTSEEDQRPAGRKKQATSLRDDEKPAEVEIEDLTEGSGEVAKPRDRILVHYTGCLADGTQFDSSRGKEPFQLQLGVTRVIQGWHQGIPGMKVGGKRKLTIPPELGYGKADKGVIPPNSVLIFEVELLKIIH